MLFSYWVFRAAGHRAVHQVKILSALLLCYFLDFDRVNEKLTR
jgi:hypothetical protein